MIITHIMGGLGNQLYQYAFGRWMAERHKTELKLDLTQCEREKNTHHNYYRLGEFNIIENVATPKEIKNLPMIHEDQLKTTDDIFNIPDNVHLWVFFGGEKIFLEIRDILLREFTLKNPLGKNSAKWKEKILASTCAVSLHVRFGDFLLSLTRNNGTWGKMMSLDFYETCVRELKKEFPNITLFVFSDDIEWCKKNFHFGVPTEFVEDCETDAQELYLMSICQHNISPSGTFSWWGAWLNQNPNKKVFLNDSKRMLSNTVDIKVNANAKPLIDFPPNLSIILYVENNSSSLETSFNSVLSQDFKDYEIILVDASTDGREEIFYEFNGQKNFTIITVDRNATKSSAWNKGLSIARGEYVLFMTVKNFIFPNTAKILAQSLYNHLKAFVEPQGKYLTASNYGKDFPDVICSNQLIEEDLKGNLILNGIHDKKFSLRVDSSLQNLGAIFEVAIPQHQKLMALGSQSINGLVGTKFFKRSFLNQNDIHFQQGGGTDPELHFIVDAFMATEKITFVPQLFYGKFK